MKVIKRRTEEQLVELARGIVTDHTMIADLNDRDWQHSLALLLPALAEYRNLGCVLVPLGPHMSGYWLNGKVPGITLQVMAVAKGDLRHLDVLIKTMHKALHPERETTTCPPT